MNIYISTFQRETKYMDNKKKALKARNDYLLGIESANASINVCSMCIKIDKVGKQEVGI
jgi:hypothetical protein